MRGCTRAGEQSRGEGQRRLPLGCDGKLCFNAEALTGHHTKET